MDDKQTPEEKIAAIYAKIPDEQAQQLIEAAANISGKPAADLTIADAMQILQGKNPNPLIDAKLDRIAEDAAAQLWENMTLEQLEQLQEAAENGDLEQVFLSIMAKLAQEAHERTAEQEAQEDPRKIVIDLPEYDPKLDPNSPEFDLEAYKAAIEAAGGFDAIGERLKGKFADAMKPATDAITSSYREAIGASISGLQEIAAAMTRNISETMQEAGIFADTAKMIVETAKEALTGITAFIQSDTYKAIKESMQAVAAFMEEHRAEFAALAEAGEEIQALAPFLQLELEEAKNDPEFADCTITDILRQGIDENGNPTESKFRQLIERAKQRRAEYEAAEDTITEIEEAAKELPRIIANPTDKVNYPLDKPNSVIWNLITDAAKNNPNGQMKLAIDTSKKGSKQDAVVLYSINFDELPTGVKITKQLTQFDKRAYIAAAALYNAGNEIITATQVYAMMGNSKTPGKEDLRKVNDSLTKMGAARVYIDNAQEVQQTKGYKHFKYDAPLLPFERISAYINGQLTESAIHLFRVPPLISFARQRNQITTISRQLLESPISKTDANLLIDDYLLERIGHMKSGKGKAPRKMLFATIYNKCNITTAKQKQRAPEKIRRYLDHYKKCGWIKGYTEEADGITIQL